MNGSRSPASSLNSFGSIAARAYSATRVLGETWTSVMDFRRLDDASGGLFMVSPSLEGYLTTGDPDPKRLTDANHTFPINRLQFCCPAFLTWVMEDVKGYRSFAGTSVSRCAAASSTDARRYRSGKYCPFPHGSRRFP